MDVTTVGQWVGIATAIAAFIIAFRKAPSERKLTEAQTSNIANEAANRIIDQLQEELSRAHQRIRWTKEDCEGQIKDLREEHDRQIAELRADLAEERHTNEVLDARIHRLQEQLGGSG